MPGSTPNMHFPYPVDADAIDVAGDIKKLADSVDTAVDTIKDKQDAGIPIYSTVASLKGDTISKLAICTILGSKRLCWRDGTAWHTKFGWHSGSKNPDANSAIYFSAAELNFTTLLSAVPTASWTVDIDAGPQWCSSRIVSNQLQVRLYLLTTGFGVLFVPTSIACSVYLELEGIL